MAQQKKDKDKAKEVTRDILNLTKSMFASHKTKVDRLNEERNFGGLSNKNDRSETMYASLADLAKDISKMIHLLRKFGQKGKRMLKVEERKKIAL